jgi:hypothetical protein
MDWIFFHFRQSFRTDDSVFAKTTKLPKQTHFVENRSPAETLVGRSGLGKRYYEIITAIHTQLASMIGRPSASLAVEATAPQKRRKLSEEAREKISAAAKARWARERKAKAKSQKANPATEKAKSKWKPAKARPSLAKKKKSSAKKIRPKQSNPATEN